MLNRYDIAYGLGVGVAAPFWLIKPSARRKVLSAFRQRMGKAGANGSASGAVSPGRDPAKPAVMIHAVSLGEVSATRALVTSLQQAERGIQVTVSTTTDTGYDRALQLYGTTPGVTVIRYPLDFSRAVARVLDAHNPDVVVLMELELWPNFLRQCQRRDIPVALINGRLTSASYGRYRLIKPVAAGMFRRLAVACVQEPAYAERFAALGVDPEKIRVTGTMKFDTAEVADRVAGDDELATAVGLYPGAEPILVAGSTGPGEEEVLLRAYRQLLARHSRLRLAIVPRHPQRFDEVAELIGRHKFKCVRRSATVRPGRASAEAKGGAAAVFGAGNGGVVGAAIGGGPIPPVVLGDTMGELRKFYALADVVVVGRTLLDLGPRQHGSDMIEPAALGRPVIVGPYTGNFAEVMRRLRSADAVMEVADEEALAQTVSILLFSPEQATAMARRAQAVVVREKGATARHTAVILELLREHDRRRFAAIDR